MLLREPSPTQADLHFKLFGFPVRIHPYFWLIAVLLGLRGSSTPPAQLMTWIATLLVSILVHELGHAFMQRHFGGRPWITLYAMGGLAACDDCDRSTRSQVLISLAGPVAGFLLALIVVMGANLTGHLVGFIAPWIKPSLEMLGMEKVVLLATSMGTIYWFPFESNNMNHLISGLLQVNILWGCVNLLPIYPLDGGHVARELCQFWKPRQGIILSLQISMFCAAGMAILGFLSSGLFIALFFGYFAYMSYRTLQAYQTSAW
ncbi:MAG: site-2 protease family protein [Pirellulales bacterium]